MRVRISDEEWWPVHELMGKDGPGTLVEVPDELVERWRRVSEEFEDLNAEMGRYCPVCARDLS